MASEPTDGLDRLLQALRDDPARRAQVRALLGDERIDALTAAQTRTEQRLEALTAHVEALTARVDDLAARMDTLAEAMTRLADRVGDLSVKVDGLMGADLERRYRERPHSYFHQIARRMRLLTSVELDDLLESAVQAGSLTALEATEVRLADGVFRGQRVTDGGEVYVVLEASVGVGPGDVERARRRADLLGKAGVEAVAVVAGTWVVPAAEDAASAHAVWQVTDGRTVVPGD